MVALGGVSACEEDPFAIQWQEFLELGFLYSIDRPEQNLPSGFDFHGRISVDVAAPTQGEEWDVLVATRDGQLVFLLPGALGIESEARILVLPDTDIDDVLVAPANLDSYVKDEPIPIRVGDSYVVRTRVRRDRFGFPCIYYARATATKVLLETEFVELRFDSNPWCNDPRLKPST